MTSSDYFDFDRESYKQLEILIRDLNALMGAFGDTKQLLEDVVENAVIPVMVNRFNRGGLRSRQWAPLSSSTDRAFDVGFTEPPLTDTGTMSALAVAKNRFEIRSDRVRYGSNFPPSRWWAPIHDFGGFTPTGGKIPARPWAIVDDELLEYIDGELNRWMNQRVSDFISSGLLPSYGTAVAWETTEGFKKVTGVTGKVYSGYKAYKSVRTTEGGLSGQNLQIARDILVPVAGR